MGIVARLELTDSVKSWLAFGATPFCAAIVIRYAPLAVGVPDRIPVAALNVTPVGSVPVSLNVGAGDPVAVTVNVPAVPSEKAAAFALVIAGGEFTVSVKFWLAFGAIPFCAANVIR